MHKSTGSHDWPSRTFQPLRTAAKYLLSLRVKSGHPNDAQRPAIRVSLTGHTSCRATLAGWTAVSGCDGWQADGGIIAPRRDGFQAHVACALHGPLIILFEQQRPDETNDGSLVGEDADHVAATLDLAVEAFER